MVKKQKGRGRRDKSPKVDKKVPLARTEEKRRSMLLASSSSRGVSQKPAYRDKRSKEAATSSRCSEGEAQITTQKSESTAANQNDSRGSSREKKNRGAGQAGRDTGRIEGEDTSTRRSSQELVEWHDSHCPECAKAPHAHYWIGITHVDGGSIFACKYCSSLQWLPDSFSECMRFKEMIVKFGVGNAYQFLLEDHPRAKAMLTKLTTIRQIRKVITDGEQLANIILALNRE